MSIYQDMLSTNLTTIISIYRIANLIKKIISTCKIALTYRLASWYIFIPINIGIDIIVTFIIRWIIQIC